MRGLRFESIRRAQAFFEGFLQSSRNLRYYDAAAIMKQVYERNMPFIHLFEGLIGLQLKGGG